MEYVAWKERPTLRAPVMVAAFSGWNDAGDAATLALRHLIDVWDARRIAAIDPEEFFEFQATRPMVRLRDDVTREIVWPPNDVYAASGPAGDVLLVLGTEPQLKWRTFCRQLTDVATAYSVRMALTFGALLAEVPHTRDVTIHGTGSSPSLAGEHDLQPSRYEGPTGIVGVLQDAWNSASVPGVSLWGAVPAYASSIASPKVALALVNRFASIVGAPVPVSSLERATREYETEVSSNVADDDDLANYVTRLETMFDSDEIDKTDETTDDDSTNVASNGSAETLVSEVEQFLRDHGGPP